MNRRLLCAGGGALVALPFLALQAGFEVRDHPAALQAWQQLAVANAILLIGACAVAADFPLASRAGRALLVGIGIPLLLPGPTVLDVMVPVFQPGSDLASWPFLLIPNLVLLLLLGGAEAGIYLLATRPRSAT